MERRMPNDRVRRHVMVRGVVQGVGFRPTVYRLAMEWGITGWVRNRSDGLEIEAEGDTDAAEGFVADLARRAPPFARVTGLEVREATPIGTDTFEILPSRNVAGNTLCPPDLATCDDCVRELSNPEDRRYRYPFINCTNCGPRFTAVIRLPYDRPLTSMACFPMCPQCHAEYRDPLNRRYHAQPNACAACGPTAWLVDPRGKKLRSSDPVADLSVMLRGGVLAAIKGIGGFHLAADATDNAAVRRLRELKGRDAKPLAVMAADAVWARRCAVIDGIADEILRSPARPIVVLEARSDSPLAPSIAPGLGTVGIMLPYSPIHHMLFMGADSQPLPPLVMTSGNLSDEPIVIGNREALRRLAACTDVLLLHDRDIVSRADDSVVQAGGRTMVFIRRSRGYVPEPILLPDDLPDSLGTGAFLKASPCLVAGRSAFVGQHVGDLSTLENVEFHRQTMTSLQELLAISPTVIGCDLNPDFPSSVWAMSQTDRAAEPVQHHHAHIVAVALEHGLLPPVLGLAIDGTGLGTDGSIWGCELLLADKASFRRVGHLRTLPLPGGDAAVDEPWRCAVGFLHACLGEDGRGLLARLLPDVDPAMSQAVWEAVSRGVHTPRHSSCGRLFDSVAALTGLCTRARFEAEAPMLLEGAIGPGAYSPGGTPPFPMHVAEGETLVLEPTSMGRDLVRSVLDGASPQAIARGFHDSLIVGLAELLSAGARLVGTDTVIVTGGCMLNRYLSAGLEVELAHRGLRCLVATRIPPGDGGVSLGQAAVAAWRSTLVSE